LDTQIFALDETELFQFLDKRRISQLLDRIIK